MGRGLRRGKARSQAGGAGRPPHLAVRIWLSSSSSAAASPLAAAAAVCAPIIACHKGHLEVVVLLVDQVDLIQMEEEDLRVKVNLENLLYLMVVEL